MRRIARFERSIDLLRPRIVAKTYTPYLCSSCKRQAASFSTTVLRTAEPKKIPFSEKIRQKLWGTDKPPGLADPYSSAGESNREIEEEQQGPDGEQAIHAPAVQDPGYEPAVNWDGLDRVGGFGYWWRDNWDPEHRYNGFLPMEVMTDSDEITAALHRAVVEVSTLQKAEKPLNLLFQTEPAEDLTWRVQIRPMEGQPALQFPDGASLEGLVESLVSPILNEPTMEGAPTESEEDVVTDGPSANSQYPDVIQGYKTPEHEVPIEEEAPTESEEDVAADRSEEDPLKQEAMPFETYQELVASWDPAWLQVSLENRDVKFAVLKRMMQLTGIRISDSTIQPSRTVQALLKHLIKPPKPKKLADALREKEELLSLPNVTIYEKRVTPIDKEKQVGRWKLIEEELKERNLPVTGRP